MYIISLKSWFAKLNIWGHQEAGVFSLLYFYWLHCYKCPRSPRHFAHLTSALASPSLWRQFPSTDFFWTWDTLYYFFAYLAMFCWKLDIVDDIMIATLGTDTLPLKVTAVVCLFSHSFQRNQWNLPLSLCVVMMFLMKSFKKLHCCCCFYF